MDGHQISWNKNVPYEDLIKQCPFLSQRASLSLEKISEDNKINEVHLSKSKKKRLKKRQKAITSTNQKTLSKESSLFLGEEIEEMSSKDKDNSNAHCKNTKKVIGEVNVQSREIITSHVDEVKSELDTKDPNVVTGKTKTTKLAIDNTRSNSSKKTLIKQSNVKLIEKSKKLAKQEVIKTQDISSDTQPLLEETKKIVSEDKLSNLVVISQNNEKSKEQVKAEREAKKRSKQLAKQQKISGKIPLKPNEEAINSNETMPSSFENNLVIDILKEKSKSQVKAERREIQDAQRAAKKASNKQNLLDNMNKENQLVKQEEKSIIKKKIQESPQSSLVLDSYVSQYKFVVGQSPSLSDLNMHMHPSVLRLGDCYYSRQVEGSNIRCLALLACLKDVINDYDTPPNSTFSQGIEYMLRDITNYLNHCRPISITMSSAFKYIKTNLCQIPDDVVKDEAKELMFNLIDTFKMEQIDVAEKAIFELIKTKIVNNDIILIYSRSSIVYRILTECHKSGLKFRVLAIFDVPCLAGIKMLKKLIDEGIKCAYFTFSSLSYAMKMATKVLLGAHGLFANGCVMSRAGTSLVAMTASAYCVPVIVCCEKYKYSDSFPRYYELGNPEVILETDKRLKNSLSPHLKTLNIIHDLTPPDAITGVVSELGIFSATCANAILKVKQNDIMEEEFTHNIHMSYVKRFI